MILEFNELAKDSPIWIFESNRELTEAEVNKINIKIKDFITKWQSHNEDVYGAYKIEYNRFIILGADKSKNNPSGCSIDGIFKLIKDIENKHMVMFFDRLTLSYIDKGGEVISSNINDFKDKISKKIVNEDTIVFNNVIREKSQLENNWKIEAAKSWHKKLFV